MWWISLSIIFFTFGQHKNVNIANFVYYRKTRIKVYCSGLFNRACTIIIAQNFTRKQLQGVNSGFFFLFSDSNSNKYGDSVVGLDSGVKKIIRIPDHRSVIMWLTAINQRSELSLIAICHYKWIHFDYRTW